MMTALSVTMDDKQSTDSDKQEKSDEEGDKRGANNDKEHNSDQRR
jgi:hypothetical protein